MKRQPLNLVFALALVMATSAISTAWGATDASDPQRQVRWRELQQDLFGNRPIAPGAHLIQIEAPARAMDAALVPITLRVPQPAGVKAVHLVIDENPAPYAAKVIFGPAGDPRKLSLRVRVNDYTHVHAVVEMEDGTLYQTSTFVKAAGGCSAPAGASDDDALQGAGQMRLRLHRDAQAAEATLMIRHPNFNGMQMNQITRMFTPARYLKEIKVTQGGRLVFDMTSDISLSADPVIGFGIDASAPGELAVQATDTQGQQWSQAFPAPGGAP